MPDAKGKQQTGKIILFGFFHGSHKILCGFFAHALQRLNVLHLQRVQIRCGMHQLRINQGLQHSLSAAVNVHGIAGDKVHQIAQQLRRTFRTGTADCRFIFIGKNRCAAYRTYGGHFKRHRICRAFFRHITQNFRDNLSSLADTDGIPHTHILFPDKIPVVQCSTADGGSCKPYRLQNRIGCQHAGASNCDDNILQYRFLDLRRVFIGRSPAGIFCRRTQYITQGKAVDLNHGTVNIKIQLAAAVTHSFNFLLNVSGIRINRIAWRHRKAQFFQVIQCLHMGF